jgi:hypothetical protein
LSFSFKWKSVYQTKAELLLKFLSKMKIPGPERYLEKPIDPEGFITKIKEVLK